MRNFLLLMFLLRSFLATAQMSKDYVPCNDVPNIIQAYNADITALNRVYIVTGSPEKRERYKKLAGDYLEKLNKLSFNTLPVGCQADYVLFKRDLGEAMFQADAE